MRNLAASLYSSPIVHLLQKTESYTYIKFPHKLIRRSSTFWVLRGTLARLRNAYASVTVENPTATAQAGAAILVAQDKESDDCRTTVVRMGTVL